MDVSTADGIKITSHEFHDTFVAQNKAVLLKGLLSDWPAMKLWTPAYFQKRWYNISVPIKHGNVSKGEGGICTMGSYVESLSNKTIAPAYMHDIPIFNIIPELKEDIGDFPTKLFPEWYRNDILRFVQFFFCGQNGYTPLHFDTLCTHNLFFQIYGEKEFHLIHKDHKSHLDMSGWRWSKLDLNDPNIRSELYKKGIHVSTTRVIPGDILFIPSQTFHQVNAINSSISFNIDWHTRNSLGRGLASIFNGAPLKNFYYNFLLALGLFFGAPSKYIFPKYKSYLNYIS